MTYFYVGDIPHGEFVVSPTLNGEPMDVHSQDVIEVLLISPSGVDITSLSGEPHAQGIDVTFPIDVSVFTELGVYNLVVIIDHTEHDELVGVTQADPVRIVADDTDSEWSTLARARDQWIDARAIDDAMLFDLLMLAQHQVLEYAPALAEGAAVPLNYKMAQISQAKNVYNGSLVDSSSGDIGEGTFAIRPFPLDWQIKQILRPRRGTPVVG